MPPLTPLGLVIFLGETKVIKPIETIYRGIKHRSRLEAKWHIFFDEIGLPCQYEPEGYEGDGFKYLPDFYLPTLYSWVEIKPFMPEDKDLKKLKSFSKAIDATIMDHNHLTFLLIGSPYFTHKIKDYQIHLLKGDELWGLMDCFMECLKCSRPIITYFNESSRGKYSYYCEFCDIRDRNTKDIPDKLTFHKGEWFTPLYLPLTSKYKAAYKKASQSRFEYGEEE